MSSYYYQPPTGATDIPDPRSLSDLPRKIAAHYFFAVIAYSHYLSLTSRSHRYTQETIQGIAFVFFPMLPIVQLCNNGIKLLLFAVQKRLRNSDSPCMVSALFGMRTGIIQSPEDTELQYGYQSTEGQDLIDHGEQSFPLLDIDRDDLVAKTDDFWTYRYLFSTVTLLGNMTVSGLSVAAYFRRVNQKFKLASYVATLGFDHRVGWLAIGGCAATIMSIPIQLINRSWSVSSRATFPETSPIWEIANQIAVAAFVQDQLQSITNRPSTFRVFRRYLVFRIELVFFWIIVIPAFAINYRRRLPRKLLYILGFFWLVTVGVVQLVSDVLEIKHIQSGELEEYNYRWAVNDPKWWSL